MKPGSILFFGLLLLPSSPVLAQSWCDVPQPSPPAGQLAIGEFGVFRGTAGDCPSLDKSIPATSRFRPGQIEIFLRLEGDASYLGTPQATRRISAFLRREDRFRDEILDIGNAHIDVDAARVETELKNGSFDWRFRIAFQPRTSGVYVLTLAQGRQEICPALPICRISIELFEP